MDLVSQVNLPKVAFCLGVLSRLDIVPGHSSNLAFKRMYDIRTQPLALLTINFPHSLLFQLLRHVENFKTKSVLDE